MPRHSNGRGGGFDRAREHQAATNLPHLERERARLKRMTYPGGGDQADPVRARHQRGPPVASSGRGDAEGHEGGESRLDDPRQAGVRAQSSASGFPRGLAASAWLGNGNGPRPEAIRSPPGGPGEPCRWRDPHN